MIYVTGDLSGDFDRLLDFAKSEEGKRLTKKDFVIELGDFGLWPEKIKEIQKLNEELNFTLLFIDGNHEHFPLLESFPRERLFGGEVHNIFGIYHLCRGEIFEIPTEEGKRVIAVCGGGDSRDKTYRTKEVNWFEQEAVSDSDISKLLIKAKEYGMQADYFLSHSMSSAVKLEWNYECSIFQMGKEAYFELTESDFKIRDLIGRIKAKLYLSAHEHIDREHALGGKKYRSIYKDFVKLY